MLVVFYISGHGFGHATRQIEVMRALRGLSPDIRIALRTSTARWMFEAAAPRPFDLTPIVVDTGVVQPDTLSLDEERTAAAATEFYSSFDRRIDDEARALAAAGADLVVSDVPPLASAAAARAGIPCVAVANFTWDWLYRGYEAFTSGAAAGALAAIEDAYASTPLALRLPLHGGFRTMPRVEEIPLIARKSQRDPADTKKILGLDPARPMVLASFGAYDAAGTDVALEAIERAGRFTILAPPREAPSGLRYEDLVAAADVVVSKPGYGIVSECIANDAALLYTSRGRFAEYDLFVREMPALLRCRYIPLDDLRAGRWADSIDALLAMAPPRERPRVDGARVAADRILALH
jgi:hypothetical protein